MNTPLIPIPAPASASLRVAACALLAVFAASAGAANSTTNDGLMPVKVKSLDKAWQKPDASLKGYTSVLIRPVTVEFSKNWRPREYGPYGLRPVEVERIRSRHVELANDALERVLSKGGLDIATAPGANVLEVQAEIVDLYVNAPDDDDVFVRAYVRNVGEMRLLLTLRDSVTGAVLFRGNDFRRGEETGRFEWASTVYNRSEAQRAYTDWARQLERLLRE
jgi:hypothetical protein